MKRDIVTSAIGILVLTLILGILYPLVVTGVGQLAFPGNANGQRIDVNGKVGFDTRPAGNAVNLEEEMMKVSANQMDYAAATSLYSKSLHLLKTAIGKG